ncbi:aminopeptidase P family protein [Coralloluteibacterium stylophorae]|uniref:Aminopeptidase P family protein n=1 Tax=Coralloluteibacterium stylophorae TaxID=1776034 RepID=A0A8J7VVX1_9GAMM|nr:aminopeptidase P family protein [Coralloluteibacterium stylophorae]MBS7459016.1 aminopeptidase P family protein [Coralloluteibacterium stylophorae]
MNANASPVRTRLDALREAMSGAGVDAVLIPSSDPHLSEYLPARWQAREWFSGFAGSAGTLAVTADAAALWVDSRYWEQAAAQLADGGVAMEKLPESRAPVWMEWLAGHVPGGGSVAVDGAVLALSVAGRLERALAARDVRLRIDLDVAGLAWPQRPKLPDAPVTAHDPAFAGAPRQERLARLRAAMAEQGADWHLVSSLDDVAWLLTLRGSDVPYNPVFLAHLLVGPDDAQLFVGAGKLAPELAEALAADGVRVRDYGDLAATLAILPARARLLFDPDRVTVGVLAPLPDAVSRIEAANPSTLCKACKSEVEARHIRAAMEEDGAALCTAFARIEAVLGAGGTLSELDVDAVLLEERARRPGFVSPSFPTIAGFNANGAMPHYRATEEAHATIAGDGLLLVDSGAQYVGGTTDVTRMLPVGTPSAGQKADCARVLKGLIALSRARFPHGIAAPLLDAIARAPLWADGVDYGHGTGHGVGYFLNVHEGPQVLSWRATPSPRMAMRPGMVSSIEPGTYRAGQWGVRIENLVMNREAAGAGFGDFLAFETLTLCPIDLRCVELSMLDAGERAWVDAYHAEVRARLAPRLAGAAHDWLLARTAAVAADG